MGKAVVINNGNFQELINGDQPVLVDFWAEWCGPCQMLTPVIEELAAEYEGKAVVGKLNVDENREIAAQLGIRSIPTLMIFKKGELLHKEVGVAPKAALAQSIDKSL